MPDYRAIARQKAEKYGLDPAIFERQIDAESSFRPNLGANSAGAIGIAQIISSTARAWGVDPTDPVASLDAAARHMAEYVKKYGGYEPALRAYNAGEGAIEKSKGYAETNNYVAKILRGNDPGKLGTPQLTALPALSGSATAGVGASADGSAGTDQGWGTGLLAPIFNVAAKGLMYVALILGGAILVGLGARRAATGQAAPA